MCLWYEKTRTEAMRHGEGAEELSRRDLHTLFEREATGLRIC